MAVLFRVVTWAVCYKTSKQLYRTIGQVIRSDTLATIGYNLRTGRELFFALLTCSLQFYTGIILQHFKEPTQHETFQYRTELGLKEDTHTVTLLLMACTCISLQVHLFYDLKLKFITRQLTITRPPSAE